MRYLIDTNIFVGMIVHDDRALLRRMRIHREESALSAIVLHELYYGAYGSRQQERGFEVVQSLSLPLLTFDAGDARAAAEIRADLRRKGTPIGPYDLLIAGQALARGLVVVTRNVGEFSRVEGIEMEDWS